MFIPRFFFPILDVLEIRNLKSNEMIDELVFEHVIVVILV